MPSRSAPYPSGPSVNDRFVAVVGAVLDGTVDGVVDGAVDGVAEAAAEPAGAASPLLCSGDEVQAVSVRVATRTAATVVMRIVELLRCCGVAEFDASRRGFVRRRGVGNTSGTTAQDPLDGLVESQTGVSAVGPSLSAVTTRWSRTSLPTVTVPRVALFVEY
jgi:hypothetical protein